MRSYKVKSIAFKCEKGHDMSTLQKYIFIFLPVLTILFIISCSDGNSSAFNGNYPAKGERFKFEFYDGLDSTRAVHILNALQRNYERIVSDLKPGSMPLLVVKIWNDSENFQDVLEQVLGIRYPGATGYVNGAEGFSILLNPNSAEEAVHEFAHVVSLNINNRFANNPRWLWEAVALYEARQFVNPNNITYMKNGNYPTLSELNTHYNQGNQKIYMVGYILLEYIVKRWGMESVIELIKTNGNIISVLGVNSTKFEEEWYNYLETKYNL